MCARKDSNLHTRRRCHLKTVRLPISPRAHVNAKMKNKLIFRNEKGIYSRSIRPFIFSSLLSNKSTHSESIQCLLISYLANGSWSNNDLSTLKTVPCRLSTGKFIRLDISIQFSKSEDITAPMSFSMYLSK